MSKKVSNSQKEYQTHEKPKRPNWGAKRGPFCISQHLLLQNIQKSEGGPFGEKFRKKNLSAEKKLKGGTVSPGIVCYAEKEEKPFWFSSLCQMMQFGAMNFLRTVKNYFDQFVWIEKVTIVVAFHFMKRRLKPSTKKRVMSTGSFYA